MKIEYLKDLEDNPTAYTNEECFANRPLAIEEIIALEQEYNNGLEFPKALRELLYLAGAGSHILDFGMWDTLKEMQISVAENITEYDILIQDPFFVIDVDDSSLHFLFLKFDEGDNPPVYRGYIDTSPDKTIYKTSLEGGSLSNVISLLLLKNKEHFDSWHEAQIYWSFLDKYGIHFFSKIDQEERCYGMNSDSVLLDQFMMGHYNMKIIDETLNDLNSLLKGEIDKIEYSVDSLITIVADKLAAKIYQIPDLSISLETFELPTPDLALIFKYWKEHIIIHN